jgi:hypothetical protein
MIKIPGVWELSPMPGFYLPNVCVTFGRFGIIKIIA